MMFCLDMIPRVFSTDGGEMWGRSGVTDLLDSQLPAA